MLTAAVRRAARRLPAALGALCLTVRAGAQGAPAPDTTPQPAPSAREVRGRVVRPGTSGMLPVASAWVTLHRVGPDSAGPLDSARTAAGGAYAFTYRAWGSEDAVYFVSASYGGIAYFGEPLRAARVGGADGEITVFDTTSAPVPITVRGRHLVVAAPGASGARPVSEVYELSNDSSLTAVARPDGATFTAVIPEAATDVRVTGGDVPAEAVTFARGRARVAAPFAPGLKQLMIAYTLAPEEFPLTLPVLGGSEVLEVLVEDPAAEVSGGGLVAVDPAPVSGRTFKRFLAQNVPTSAVVRVVLPEPPVVGRTRYLALVGGVIAAAMVGALLRALLARRRAAAARHPAPAALPSAERIAREIAALDATFERQAAPDAGVRARYTERRAALKAQLTAAMAEHGAGQEG